jgi:hypothetical protein
MRRTLIRCNREPHRPRVVPKSDTVSDLAGIADCLRTLDADDLSSQRFAIARRIEMGRLLSEARKLTGHGGWLPWLKAEFEWDERTARRYVSAYKLSLAVDPSGLNISVGAVHTMAALRSKAGLSDEQIARNREHLKVISEKARKQRVTGEDARAIINTDTLHKSDLSLPKPSEAEAKAAADRKLIAREKNIHRVVEKELATDFGMQAFLDAAPTIPPERLLKFIERLQVIYDERTANGNVR